MKNDLGMSRDDAGVIRAKCKADGLPDPFDAYRKHRQNAEQRGIEWRFTFSTWWAIWADYYRLRGKGKNALCMARNGDKGAYAPGNVYLTTNLGNSEDMYADGEKVRRQRERAAQKACEKRQRDIENAGAPSSGYGWKHSDKSSRITATRSEAMKQTTKAAEYLACFLDDPVQK